ncbi:hypothetical protein [Vibrio sp. 1S139]|uniref:hypothetical protein n=1 Tax=Vibrio sp. 1S139 TaxID=3230006 RepID=UPI00352EC7D8
MLGSEIEILTHKEELIYLPEDEIVEYPARYYTEVGSFDFHRRGTGDCPTVQIRNNIKIELTIYDKDKGKVNVSIFTYDSTGNVADTSFTQISSDVVLRPGKPIVVSSPSSRDYFKFHHVVVRNGRAFMKIAVVDFWTIRVNGAVCHRGHNTFSNHQVQLGKIALRTIDDNTLPTLE